MTEEAAPAGEGPPSTTVVRGGPATGPVETRVSAFLAAATLTGRTNMVGNLALLLARAGRRVLVVDVGRGAVRVHDHLSSFYAEQSAITDHLPTSLTELLFALPGFAPGSTSLRRYAVAPGRLDVVAVPDVVEWPSVTQVGSGPEEALRVELRRQLRFTEYDDVLLDAPEFTPTVAQWLAVLCDTVVVCLPYRRPELAAVAAVAREVHRAAPAGVRIIAATTGLDGPPDTVTGYADQVRQRFLGALDEPTLDIDFAQVEIPGPPGSSLAALLEDSPHRDRVLDAYGSLLDLVTVGEVSRALPEPDAARDRYRRGLGRQTADESGTVCLAYREAQRPWADWLRGALVALGLRVRGWSRGGTAVDGPFVVLVVDPEPATPPDSGVLAPPLVETDDDWLNATIQQVRDRPDAELMVVRTVPVTGLRPDAERVLDLAGCTEEPALRRLRGALGLATLDPAPAHRAWRVGYPGGSCRDEPVPGLPTPPRDFVGRDRELGGLRDLLLAGVGTEPVVVRGPAAAGKTSLVRTYVDRFRADYDLVAWLPAGNRHDLWRALTALAERVGFGPRGNSVQELLKELAGSGDQWLLVYDGVVDPADLTGLVPGGSGHVVVTRGGDSPPGSGPEVAVGELTSTDAVRLLTRQVTGLSTTGAATVVEAVGGFPLDLWLSCGLLDQAGILLDKRDRVPGQRAVDAAVQAFVAAVAPSTRAEPATGRIVRVALRLMGEELSGRIAVVLAQMFAFAAPDGLSLTLAQSRRVRAQVAAGLDEEDAALLRADGWEVDRALTVGLRYRIFDVTWGSDGLVRMHPAVQAIVRDEMEPAQRTAGRDRFLLGLAGAAPRTTAAGSVLRHELHRHLLSSGALAVDDPDEVRRFLVEQLEHLIARGEGEVAEALRLWRPVLDRWLTRHDWADQITLRLATRLADVTRMLGRNDEALALSRVVVERGAALLGPDHPRVLVARRGLAGDLRGLGRFRPALIEDQATWRGFRDQFGNSHPETLIAAYNLANSYHLAGRTDEAARVARQTLSRRLRLFPEDHPDTLRLSGDLGRYLTDLGETAEAYRLLTDVYQRRVSCHGEEDMLLLRTVRHLAVTERRRGYLDKAKALNSRAHLVLRRLLGEDSPKAQSCRLSLAVDYHLAGETDKAVRLAEDSLARYERDLVDDHPFVHLCRSVRAVLIRHVEVTEAAKEGRVAADGLASRLGESHPWTLAARINQAGNLAVLGRLGTAEKLLGEVLDEGRNLLGPDHPHLLAARRLRVVMLTDGETSDGFRLRPMLLDFVDLEVPET